MEEGEFYASTGVELEDYQLSPMSMTIVVKEEESAKYRTVFIGKEGQVLSESISNPATYRFRGDELYVRAKVFDSNGNVAWLQPVMVNRP